MCGGRGTRLDAPVEKPLLEVAGRPMVARVLDALESSTVDTVHAVCSPHAPNTRAALDTHTIDAPGDGYVDDLQYALTQIPRPALTVAADLPLLRDDDVEHVLDAFDGASVTVCVPIERKRSLGASVDTTIERDGRTLAPAGINVVADTDATETLVVDDVGFAVNVNRPADAHLAAELLRHVEDTSTR